LWIKETTNVVLEPVLIKNLKESECETPPQIYSLYENIFI
jgi:hypothetical protein